MSYQIRKTNQSLLVEIQPEQIDTTATSLTLFGPGYTYYGQSLDNNFVALVENFASLRSPPNPLSGQTWYDTGVSKLKLYDGSAWQALVDESELLNYLTLAQYEADQNNKGNFVTLSYLTSQKYATEAWVLAQGYLTKSALNGFLTGNQPISLTGDATGTGSTTIAVTLSATGVSTGTYTKVVVDTKGRVTAGGSINAQDVINALGFTPGQGSGGSGGNSPSFSFGPLGTAAGSTIPMVSQSFTDANNETLLFSAQRNANGSTSATASARLQLLTDSQPHGYIEFNPAASAGGVGIGVNNSPGLLVNSGLIRLLNSTRINSQVSGNPYLSFSTDGTGDDAVISFAPSTRVLSLSTSTQPVTIDAAGTITTKGLFVQGADGTRSSGVFNPQAGLIELHAGNVQRLQISTSSAANATLLTYGPQSTTNPSGLYNLYLGGDGSLSVNTNSSNGKAASNQFSVKSDGSGYFAGSVLATGAIYGGGGIVSQSGNLECFAQSFKTKGSVTGTSGNYMTFSDPKGVAKAGMYYDGFGTMQISSNVTSTGFQKPLTLDSYGNVNSPSTISAQQFLLTDNATFDTGFATPSTGRLTVTVGGKLRQSYESTGAQNFFFGSNVGATSGTYYSLALQDDRNIVLYSITAGKLGSAVWSTQTSASDRRLKQNIRPMNDALYTVQKLNPVHFNYKPDQGLPDGERTGFIAQEVATLIPQAVYEAPGIEGSGSTMILHKEEIIPYLVKALQQVIGEVESLRSRISWLESGADNE